jgi:hypothetical protein
MSEAPPVEEKVDLEVEQEEPDPEVALACVLEQKQKLAEVDAILAALMGIK